MTVLSWLLGFGGIVFLVLVIVYCWRNRPYVGPGTEDDKARRDEAALQADAFVNRSGNQ